MSSLGKGRGNGMKKLSQRKTHVFQVDRNLKYGSKSGAEQKDMPTKSEGSKKKKKSLKNAKKA